MAKQKTDDKICGIIMPISDHPEYDPDHWKDVLEIINESIGQTDFKPKLVSHDEAIGLIQERIVTNIYSNEIVVCDVSSQNPNVMFELGMRLAFDKPVIIINDGTSNYSFDIGGIEHIEYPKSLKYQDITTFKKRLAESITATYQKSKSDDDYSPFLKSFGRKFEPSQPLLEETSGIKSIYQELAVIKRELQYLTSNQSIKIVKDYNERINTVDNFMDKNIRRTRYPKKLKSIDLNFKNAAQPSDD